MINRRNYLLVKEFSRYQRETLQLNPKSITRYWFYLKFLLLWADETCLAQAPDLQPSFPRYLAEARRDGQGGSLAPSTLRKIVQTAKQLFLWAKLEQPLEFRHLSMSWINTLRPPVMVQRASTQTHIFLTLEEVRQLIAAPIPEGDLALWRDQAATALLFLSGMRDGAFTSLPIQAVDLPNRRIYQWPFEYGVRTKKGKSATTFLLEIPDLLAMAERWDRFVRAQLPPTAMWYTPVINHWGEQTLSTQPAGAHRNIAIAKRLRAVFALAGLPYKSPHKFRHGHAVHALRCARSMADYKAISQNLMHDDIRITDETYASLLNDEVQERIRHLLAEPNEASAVDGELEAFLRKRTKKELLEALTTIAKRLGD